MAERADADLRLQAMPSFAVGALAFAPARKAVVALAEQGRPAYIGQHLSGQQTESGALWPELSPDQGVYSPCDTKEMSNWSDY